MVAVVMRRLIGLAFIVAPGCAYSLHIESDPPGALVELPNGARVSAPDTVKVRWSPLRRLPVRVTAPGYRPLEIDLRRREVNMRRVVRSYWHPFRRPDGHVEFILVATHGPAGTWTPEELGLE